MSEVLNMSGIMTLRTLICENINATHDFQPTPQFILSYDRHDERCSVEVGHPWTFDSAGTTGGTLLAGHGLTPELAYQDLLKKTAIRVSKRDYASYPHKSTHWEK